MELIATGGAATPGALSLAQSDLGNIQTTTLRLGSPQAGPITIGAPINLEPTALTLNVQSAGSAIADTDLQTAVETAVNASF